MQISLILPFDEPVPSIKDIPDLIPDYQPAAKDATAKLASLVSKLLNRVVVLESL